ncbi:L-arabinose transport system permease protein AraQ [Caprobacter fermentans]|uniref:Carbohydrate ABC transporter permease n=1 Tax=Caproicibacter fermentans TaxID=2576756 RepID=A0A6N8HVI5_9FIRM|nr:carbohydrate ABC transporter permease [Caproicibacter fermentans]MVB09811.1 L-arabinose transport system permease protein AraQ [Caproicibacter fermentans]OCN02065.1 sugar ABC transporter permease [Clostridium sp. W14A]QNK42310.1 carbohydrate ABC transporter permease [Caproicibacter fermentans]
MRSSKVTHAIGMFALSLLLLVFLSPFLITILNTFKSTQEFVENPFSLPTQFNFDNYFKAIDEMSFATGFVNSLIITLVGVVIVVIFSAMTAYLFARFTWKINKVLFFVMTASMAIPFQVVMIPLVTIYGTVGFIDSRESLLFMYFGFGCSLAVFTFHGFIKGIPFALEEAASIDGSGRVRTFFQIILPLLKPVVSTITVLDVLWMWNDYLLPSLILQSPELRTLPLSTYNFFSSYSVDFTPLMAGLILTMLPVLVLYLFLQKYIIKGLAAGAVK